ncbi:hypothetical protein Gpo141_00000700 [Globisporangium polare]
MSSCSHCCCSRARVHPAERKKYSVKRLLALHEYCQTTSRAYVFLVLLLFSTPALIIMIFFDCLPLRDPAEGWRANWVYWVRIGLGSSVISLLLLIQVRLVVPEIILPNTRVAVISIATGVANVGYEVLLAVYWKFPVPFTYTVGGVPLLMILNVLVVITIGVKDRALLKKCFDFSNTICVQAGMLLVYPAYNAVFTSLEGNARLPFVLLLPVIKHILKIVTKQVSHERDELLTASASSVEIFDALYMTKCMQSAGTLLVGVGIIVIDMAHNYAAILKLGRRTRTLRVVNSFASEAASEGQRQVPDLLSWVVEILAKTQHGDWLAFRARKIRVASLQSQQNTLSRVLSIMPQLGPPIVLTTRAVIPFPPPVRISRTTSTEKATFDSVNNEEAVAETAELLQLSESVVIVEYIEAVVPVVYAIYITVLYHLPNAKYYQDMEKFTEQKMHSVVANIAIYAIMEFLSLMYVYFMLKRRAGINVFYQLAFALESEWPIYQCEFVSWIIIVFQFLMVHSGADFTFRFDWDTSRTRGSL